MSRVNLYYRFLITFVAGVAFCCDARGQTVGVQAVGLARWHDDDVAILSNLLVQTGGATEVAYLPFEFTLNESYDPNVDPLNDPPFVRARLLVTNTLPRIQGTLTLTTQLYFHNGGSNDSYQEPFRWQAFKRNRNGSFANNALSDRSFRARYRERCLRSARFLNRLYAWAEQNGSVSKLGLVTVPDLEDDFPSLSDYLDAQRFVIETYAEVGASTQYRRSVRNGDRNRPPGVPLERHGDTSTVNLLRRGDLYSNDGTPISIATAREFDNYLSSQRRALRSGVSVLFWREAYNGPRGTFPFRRGTLRPLTNGEPGRAETAALRRVLQTR